MKKLTLREHMGFNAHGRHQRELTDLEAWMLDCIRTWGQRLGEPAIPARVLADYIGLRRRNLRRMINHLISRRYHGLPIYMLPGFYGGYFLGESEAARGRARTAVTAQLRRAKTSAAKARDLGATAQELAQGVVQLTLSLGGDVPAQVLEGLADSGRGGPASHAEVVSALRRYARDPRAFARQIAELREQFGGLFVRREDLARVLRKHQERMIHDALGELGGRSAA